jgi:hypothetical protein
MGILTDAGLCPAWDAKIVSDRLREDDRLHRIRVSNGEEACICMTEDDVKRYLDRRSSWWKRLVACFS